MNCQTKSNLVHFQILWDVLTLCMRKQKVPMMKKQVNQGIEFMCSLILIQAYYSKLELGQHRQLVAQPGQPGLLVGATKPTANLSNRPRYWIHKCFEQYSQRGPTRLLRRLDLLQGQPSRTFGGYCPNYRIGFFQN